MTKLVAMPGRLVALVVLTLGAANSAIANGRMEDTLQSFYHEVRDAYNDTVKYLEAGNTNEGAIAAKRLAVLTGRLYESLNYLEKSAHDLSPRLEEAWRPTMSAFGAFNTQAKQLDSIVGEKDFRDTLRVLKDTFERTGTEWLKSYDAMKEYGKKFNEMCESCR
jgi:hypothetical protein